MLFPTELLPLENYRTLMELEEADPNHPMPQFLNGVDDMLKATHIFHGELNVMLDLAACKIHADDRQLLQDAAGLPRAYLRGMAEKTDMFSDAVPDGWNYIYMHNMVINLWTLMSDETQAILSEFPEIANAEFALALANAWAALLRLNMAMGRLQGSVQNMISYDEFLRDEEQQDEDVSDIADYFRIVVQRSMHAMTGCTPGDAISERKDNPNHGRDIVEKEIRKIENMMGDA